MKTRLNGPRRPGHPLRHGECGANIGLRADVCVSACFSHKRVSLLPNVQTRLNGPSLVTIEEGGYTPNLANGGFSPSHSIHRGACCQNTAKEN